MKTPLPPVLRAALYRRAVACAWLTVCERQHRYPHLTLESLEAAIAAELEAAGLPYTIVGLGGMLYVPEVADVRALLTAASDPERGDRVVRLLTGFGIGARDLRALAAGHWVRCCHIS